MAVNSQPLELRRCVECRVAQRLPTAAIYQSLREKKTFKLSIDFEITLVTKLLILIVIIT